MLSRSRNKERRLKETDQIRAGPRIEVHHIVAWIHCIAPCYYHHIQLNLIFVAFRIVPPCGAYIRTVYSISIVSSARPDRKTQGQSRHQNRDSSYSQSCESSRYATTHPSVDV